MALIWPLTPKKFRVVAQDQGPYLYRWFADRLPADAQGGHEATALFESERDAVAAGRMAPVGLRIIGKALLP